MQLDESLVRRPVLSALASVLIGVKYQEGFIQALRLLCLLEVLIDLGQVKLTAACLWVLVTTQRLHEIISMLARFNALILAPCFLIITSNLCEQANLEDFRGLLVHNLLKASRSLNEFSHLLQERRHFTLEILVGLAEANSVASSIQDLLVNLEGFLCLAIHGQSFCKQEHSLLHLVIDHAFEEHCLKRHSILSSLDAICNSACLDLLLSEGFHDGRALERHLLLTCHADHARVRLGLS